jgi:hypothetical protein
MDPNRDSKLRGQLPRPHQDSLIGIRDLAPPTPAQHLSVIEADQTHWPVGRSSGHAAALNYELYAQIIRPRMRVVDGPPPDEGYANRRTRAERGPAKQFLVIPELLEKVSECGTVGFFELDSQEEWGAI